MQYKILLILMNVFLVSSSFAQTKEVESWEAPCKAAKALVPPESDQPSAESLTKLKDCNSEELYYGISVPVDYEKARLCAFAQLKAGDEFVFGGSAVLMMLYANGLGVKKNIPLAEKFACNLEGAPAEMEGRIASLEKLKSSTSAAKTNFDLCDDITSGYMQGHCADHAERMVAIKRKATMDALTAKWTEAERNAFKELKAASEGFTKERSDKEVDLSGTARSAFIVQEEAIQNEDFLESVQKLEAGKAPKYSSKQYKEEDQKLNSLYSKIQKGPSEFYGTITKDGVKKAQKSWLQYRDAWVKFAKLKYPAYSSDSIAAWFTKKRNHMLKSFSNEP